MGRRYARYGSLVERPVGAPRKWDALDAAILAAVKRGDGPAKFQILLRIRQALPSRMDPDGQEVAVLLNNRLTQLRKWGKLYAQGPRGSARWFPMKGSK